MLAAFKNTASSSTLRSCLASRGLHLCLPVLCRASSSAADQPNTNRSRRRIRQKRTSSPLDNSDKSINFAETANPAPQGTDTLNAQDSLAAADGDQQVLAAAATAHGVHRPSVAAAATADAVEQASSAAAATAAADEDAQLTGVPQPLSNVVPVPAPGQPQFADAPFQLRPYQLEAIREIIKEWKEGNNAQLVMLPTGGGKTVLFAALARYLSQHYVEPNPAATAAAAAPVADTSSSTSAAAPVVDASSTNAAAGSAQQRGRPTVALASASEGSPPAEDFEEFAPNIEDLVALESSSTSSTDSSDEEQYEPKSVGSSSTNKTSSRLRKLQEALGCEPSAPVRSQGPSPQPSSTSTSPSGSSSPAAEAASDLDTSSSHASSNGDGGRRSTTRRSSATNGSKDDSSSQGSSSTGKGSKGKKGRKPRQQQQEKEAAVADPPRGMRVLVLAHRYELLRQAEEKFRLMWGAEDLSLSWVKGSRKDFNGQVVIASVATAVNCIPKLAECNFSLVVVDEAHHSVAPTYRVILQGLGLIEEVPAPPPADPQQPDSSDSSAAALSSLDSFSEGQQRSSMHSLYGFFEGQRRSSMDSLDEGEEQLDAGTASAASASSWGEESESSEASAADEEGSSSTAASGPKMMIRVKPNPHQLLLGFTATPYRMKKAESEDLYSIFPSYSYARTIQDMIRDNHLTQVRSEKILTQTDLKGALVGASGDFSLSKLSALVNSRSRNRLVLAAYIDHCTEPAPEGSRAQTAELDEKHRALAAYRGRFVAEAMQGRTRRYESKQSGRESSAEDGSYDEEGDEDEEEAREIYAVPSATTAQELTGGLSMAGRRAVRKTIAFAVDIKHAEAMNAVFGAAGVCCSAIHSLMPHELVKAEIARFRSGELDVLFNCEVLTEGFDEPAVNAILMARPTRSEGLYTQMLGRGLRIMPGKQDCLVLDFTDKYHQAGKIVDTRVLLPDVVLQRDMGDLPEKGPSRVDEDAVGGEFELVASALDPLDLAWSSIGPHWMTSVFNGGNVWLVHTAGMGPTQRQRLALPAATPAVWFRTLQKPGMQTQPATDGSDDDSDSDDDSSMDEDSRYVILHQEPGMDSASEWTVAFQPQGHGWSGLSQVDACGAALTYIERWAHDKQRRVVMEGHRARTQQKWAGRGGQKSNYAYKADTLVSNLKKDAPWRRQPMSDGQRWLMEKLEIPVLGRMTKGEASDLISAHKCGLATPSQLEELRARLNEEFDNLPVPLLKAHADKLLAEG